jgi:hypothetical protein
MVSSYWVGSLSPIVATKPPFPLPWAEIVELAILARVTPFAGSHGRTSFVCDLPPTTVDTLVGPPWLPAVRAGRSR